jgi:DedD protein
MDEAAKRRLVGAAVLVALAVIFVPMLVEQEDDERFGDPIVIPDSPVFGTEQHDQGRPEFADDVNLPGPDTVRLPLPVPEPPQSLANDQTSWTGGSTSAVDDASDTTFAPAASPASSRPAASNQPANPTAVAEPPPLPAGVQAWVVQVISLRDQDKARTIRDSLRGKGFPSFVAKAEVDGQTYYRVQVGPEVERERADRLAEQLKSETSNPPFVKRYP